MNNLKWNPNADTDLEEKKKPNNMASSLQLPPTTTSTCPSTSSMVAAVGMDYIQQTTKKVYNIESIVSTYTTPASPYKYTRHAPSPRVSPEVARKFARDKRNWESFHKGKKYTPPLNGVSFVVMSYNILAQTLLEGHFHLYKNTPSDFLNWTNRWKRLTSEISQQNPDIICLQEVETSYLDEIGSFLNNTGYKGIFKQKTGIKVDGCAIFFKSDLFEIMDYLSVEYMQPGVNLLNRDNIGMMIKLTSKSNKDLQFIVCTTHLLYNPKRTDVRLAQIQLFLAEIDRFSYREDGSNSDGDHLPIILTGDLNSLPNTPVTNLLDQGNVLVESSFPNLFDVAVTNACQHLEIYLERLPNSTLPNGAMSMLYHSEYQMDQKKPDIEKKYSFEEYRHLFQNDFRRHNLNFTSVYDHLKSDGETEASTYQDAWVTVDYMYYSSSLFGKIQVLGRYRLPSAFECREIGNIPNSVYGSDHFSLAAKFLLTPNSENSSNKKQTTS